MKGSGEWTIAVIVIALALLAGDIYAPDTISGASVVADSFQLEGPSGGVNTLPATQEVVVEGTTPNSGPPQEEPEGDVAASDTQMAEKGNSGKGQGGGGGGSGKDKGGKPKDPPEEMHFSLSTNPTDRWIDVYGSLTIGKKPAQVGDEVAAFDADGVLCGVYRVKSEGQYGFLHVYGDDGLSPEDEGASAGDSITFKVYDWSRGRELSADASVTVSWSGNKQRINVDLVA
jgi:hypothetical protein